jgi:hypothetical protein
MQLILDESIIYNKNKLKIQFEPKFGEIGLQIYIFFKFLIYKNVGPKNHLQSTCFSPLGSTIYNENNGKIYNLQFDLAPLL